MSITDELRKYANRFKNSHDAWSGIGDELTAIADRIDAEHEAKAAEVASGWDYWESTHIELPKDADNVPWNVGDRDEDGNVVTQLRLSSDGWYAITDGPSAFHPEQRRHHHAPTVEDVLREFTDAILEWSGKSGTVAEVGTWSDVAAEYAAKLQLKEDK